MHRKLILAACLGAAALSSAARASELLFTYSEPGGIDFSFEQSSTPTPLLFNPGDYTDVPVTEISSNIGAFDSIAWYSTAEEGQFDTDTSLPYVVVGPQIYSGPESAPVFSPGVFPGTDNTDSLGGTLTITAVPEPSSWLLMMAGIGGLGLIMRRARKTSDVEFKDALVS